MILTGIICFVIGFFLGGFIAYKVIQYGLALKAEENPYLLKGIKDIAEGYKHKDL